MPIKSDLVVRIIHALALAFGAICIFDPGDLVLRLKVVIFVLLWCATLFYCLKAWQSIEVPIWLVIYVLVFTGLPLFSIVWYFLINGQEPFEGFQLFKGYLLISLALVLVIARIDLLGGLSVLLTGMAIAILVLSGWLQIHPEQFDSLHAWASNAKVLFLDRRQYAKGFTLTQIYFAASPLLVLSIAYYSDRAFSTHDARKRISYGFLLVLNMAGMFIAGTRNNIFVSILLPILLLPFYIRRYVRYLSLVAGAALCVCFILRTQLAAFFDLAETGNSIKVVLFYDYIKLWDDSSTLLFGQGLGAYHYWSARAYSTYISELTYLEIIRNFGIFGFLVTMLLLLMPPLQAFLGRFTSNDIKAVSVSYILTLGMAISNPHLFQSSGVLILSVLLAKIFMNEMRERSFS